MKQQPEKKCYLGHDGPLVLSVGAQPGDDDAALCGPCAESWARFVDGREERPRTREGYDADFREWVEGQVGGFPPETIPAHDAVLGQWYVVPSGEIEKAVSLRGDREGAQVGFLHVAGNPNDPDDIRWLPADMGVTRASDEDVEAWRRGFVKMSHGVVAPAGLTSHHVAITTLLETPPEALCEAAQEEPTAAREPAHKLEPLFSSESGEWQTDPGTFAWLSEWAKSRWGSGFVLDVCASEENALCHAYFTQKRNCLNELVWPGPWFMNPPYGDGEAPCKVPHERCKKKGCKVRGSHTGVAAPGIGDFVLAGRRQAQQGRPGMCLLPYRPDTEWWRLGVLAPDGEQVAMGGDWAQGWSWARWSSGLLVEVRLISGRLSFLHPAGEKSWTAPFPSVVVVFDRWK